MRTTRRTFTEEFRIDAVALCRRGDRPLVQVARDLGINHWTLRDWYRSDEMRRSKKKLPPGAPVPQNETLEEQNARLQREVQRLQRVNAQLEMDREILKKAAAFFAKESE